MEISGAVLRRSHILPAARELSLARSRFSDEGHLRYYKTPVRCGKKEEKKRAKLLKGLSKDLSAFYSMGFGVGAGEGMAGDVKGKMMTEAAELLLSQLKQMKAAEKELKKKRKAEKAAMKAARAKDGGFDDKSSSSSSESSYSECESVARTTCNRMNVVLAEPKAAEMTAIPAAAAASCSSSSSCWPAPAEKIEVCMGGECRKSGAMELMAEFERMVGVEGTVVGCKCMGKCRDGPNVRLSSVVRDDGGAVKVKRNPLCIGVGLEDVGDIVAELFRDNIDAGLLAAV